MERSKKMLSTDVSGINHNCQIENICVDVGLNVIRLGINSKIRANAHVISFL